MDEDDCLVLGQHDVRLAWEVFAMKSEAVAEPMQSASHYPLGLRVLSADTRHVETALFGREDVGHPMTPESFRNPYTDAAILEATSGGTALPTCTYWEVRGPQKK